MKFFRRLDAIPGRLADLIVGHPVLVIVALLFVTAIAGISALRLRFDFNPNAVFSGDNPEVRYNDQFRREFGYDDTVIIVGMEATGKTDVLSPAALTWQAQVVDHLKHLANVERVVSLISMQTPHVTLGLQPQMSYEPIIDQVPVTTVEADVLRERLSVTDLPFGSIVSRDERMCAIMAMFRGSDPGYEEMRGMVDDVDATLAKYPVPEGYKVMVGGLPVLRVGIVRDLQKDQIRLMPLAGILYLITLALAFRSIPESLLPLFAVGQGLLWIFGLMAALSQPLNIVSNILPCMLLINGVSNSIHVITRYVEEAAVPGTSLRDATRHTMRQMLVACLGAFATAAVGFYVLRTASSPVLKEFGTQAALGLCFLYVTVLLTLGALLQFIKPPRFHESPGWRAFSLGLTRLSDRLVGGKWITVTAFLLIAGVSLFFARNVEINSSALETYDETNSMIVTLRALENHLSGLLPLEISLHADSPEPFYKPEVFRNIAILQRFATDQKGVLFARSYVDFVNELNLRTVGEEKLTKELPPLGEEGKRRIDRARLFLGRVADEMQYWEFMTHDGTRARLLLKIRDVGTRDTLALVQTLNAKMAELFPPGSGIQTRVTGDAYTEAVGLTEMIHELLFSILTAALVIFGLIAILFRSLRIGLITIPPNVIPLVVTFGYMGLRGFDLNAGNVIVFTISLGIAVDNTIHYILRFREEYGLNPDIRQATWRTMMGKGQPMCLSTLLTVIGLAVLLFSDFVPTRRFAELTIVTLTGALVGAVFLLPACVAILWKRTMPASEEAAIPAAASGPQVAGRLPH